MSTAAFVIEAKFLGAGKDCRTINKDWGHALQLLRRCIPSEVQRAFDKVVSEWYDQHRWSREYVFVGVYKGVRLGLINTGHGSVMLRGEPDTGHWSLDNSELALLALPGIRALQEHPHVYAWGCDVGRYIERS